MKEGRKLNVYDDPFFLLDEADVKSVEAAVSCVQCNKSHVEVRVEMICIICTENSVKYARHVMCD